MLGLSEAMAGRKSPLRLPFAVPVPLFIAVGGRESDEHRLQARATSDVWRVLGPPDSGIVTARRWLIEGL